MVPVSGEESQLLQATRAKEFLDRYARLSVAFPTIKTSFPHFNLTSGSSELRPHDQKVVKALDSDLQHLDNPRATPTDLTNLSVDVDPANSTLLSMSTNVGMTVNLQKNQYTAFAYLLWDVYSVEVAAVLNR